MRLVMAISVVIGFVGFGVSNVEFGASDNLSEVALLVSGGVTLWVAGLLARPGTAHPAERPVAASAALAAPFAPGGRTGSDGQQTADRQAGKATAIAAV